MCYRRKVCSVAAGLAQMFHLYALRDSLRGHLGVLQAHGWLCCFIHLCVLQVWLSWGSLTCVTGRGGHRTKWIQIVYSSILVSILTIGVTAFQASPGAGLAQVVHLCVLQTWLSWGSLVCYRRRVGLAQMGHLCVLQVWLSWGLKRGVRLSKGKTSVNCIYLY